MWQEAYDIFDQALDLSVDERAPFLSVHTAGNPELARIVADLLDEADGDVHAGPQPVSRIGERFGRYEITRNLGFGGSGEVFAARDLELDRMVALKFVARHSDLAQRLEAEARAASALNHPGIVTIYEVVRQNGDIALAMELVEGRTLREYCGNPQPASVAVEWCRQIALALAAAHEGGIVHRDIKPENLIVRPDACVKILDFGIARRIQNVSRSNTTTGLAGTWNYLSPERAHGRAVGPASDIFSLGVVLHELLSGSHPFADDSPVDTAHAIAYRSPKPLPLATPAHLVDLVEAMLAKEPDQRPCAAQVAERLAGRLAGLSRNRPRRGMRWRWIAAAATLLAVVAIGAASYQFLPRRNPFAGPSTHFTFQMPPGVVLSESFGPAIAISADGSTVAFAGVRGDQSNLYYRRFRDGVTRVIPGTTNASMPVLSQNGQRIAWKKQGYVFEAKIDGTAVRQLGKTGQSIPEAGLYTKDNFYFIAPPQQSGTKLETSVWKAPLRQPGDASEALGLLDPNTLPHELHTGIRPLPDGQFLVSATRSDRRETWILDPESGVKKLLVKAAGGFYSQTGHIIYHRGSTLYAAPLDLRRRELSGPEAAVRTQVASVSWAGGHAALSDDGTLVYIEGGKPVPDRTLAWVDLNGKETSVPVPPGPYLPVDLSPDGRHALLAKYDDVEATWSLWLMPIGATGEWKEVSQGHASQTAGVFTVAGDGILFNRMGTGLMRRQITPELSAEEVMAPEPEFARYPVAPVKGQKETLFVEGYHPGIGPILYLSDSSRRVPSSVLMRYFLPRVSPDLKWVAMEKGRHIYVVPYSAMATATPIDVGPGMTPAWSPNGQTLYLVNGDKQMVAVPFDSRGRVGKRLVLFNASRYEIANRWFSTLPLSKDGRRFLVARNPKQSPAAPITTIHVVQNWFADVNRLAQLPH